MSDWALAFQNNISKLKLAETTKVGGKKQRIRNKEEQRKDIMCGKRDKSVKTKQTFLEPSEMWPHQAEST